MTPMLPGHHSPITAFAPSVQHHSLKWATRGNSFVAPAVLRTQSLHVLQAQSPLSIIGGAAAKIAAANTDTLSTAALTTMFLLALQYCAQPPLTRRFLNGRANKKGITMVEGEIMLFVYSIYGLTTWSIIFNSLLFYHVPIKRDCQDGSFCCFLLELR